MTVLGSAVDCLQVAHLLALPQCVGVVRLIVNATENTALANLLLSTLSTMGMFGLVGDPLLLLKHKRRGQSANLYFSSLVFDVCAILVTSVSHACCTVCVPDVGQQMQQASFTMVSERTR